MHAAPETGGADGASDDARVTRTLRRRCSLPHIEISGIRVADGGWLCETEQAARLVRVTMGDDHSSATDLACHRRDGLVRVRSLCAGADDTRPAGQPGVQGAGVGCHRG